MNSERSIIDPDGRYGTGGLTRAESNAMAVIRSLPVNRIERTRSAFELHLGDQEEQQIVLIVTAEAIEFRLPTVEWTCGAYGPVLASRLWKRVTWNQALTPTRITELAGAAMKKRSAQFKRCKDCGRKFPPEHRHGSVCHGCAERYHGIAH